jgi:hypothetical protein
MIDTGNNVLKANAENVSDKRHHPLEKTEIDTDDRRFCPVHLPHRQALADGHGKTIHPQSQTYQDYLGNSHL